jgi:hypothetical protein
MQTCNPNTGEIQHKYNIDDLAIIDDEAGFAFNNGTFEGEGCKTEPGTELGNGDPNGDIHDDDDQGDDEALAGELAELRRGLESTSRWRDSEAATFVLANFRNNENFCLGSGNVDGGNDGYSPLGVFGLGDDGLDGDDYGNSESGDGDEHHHEQHSCKTGAQTNKRAARLTLAWEALLKWELPGAKRQRRDQQDLAERDPKQDPRGEPGQESYLGRW